MRNIKRILWSLIFIMGLAGCAAPEGDPEQMITVAPEMAQREEAPEESRDLLAFAFQDQLVIPGKPLPKEVEEAAHSSQQSTTCVGTGMETLYQYESFDITVQNSGSGNAVCSVYFKSADAATREGLSIGDSQEKVGQLYGDAVTQGGIALICTDGSSELIILVSG